MRKDLLNRRSFLGLGTALAATVPSLARSLAAAPPLTGANSVLATQIVSISRCRSYDVKEVKTALGRSFDELGGLRKRLRGKTVTVKINLTGSPLGRLMNRPAGETFVTHEATAAALGALVLEAGAKRVRYVESSPFKWSLEQILGRAGWDIQAFHGMGDVEFENTRNLGDGSRYATLSVPHKGHLFSEFEVNHSYADTDFFVSLTKLKEHITAGVTLSIKNLFGVTPNSLYGDDRKKGEEASRGRGTLHFGGRFHATYPGIKEIDFPHQEGFCIPRILADLAAARPIDLAVVDGITSISGGEGPWVHPLKFVEPGVLLTGLNPVATDVVGMAVMGFDNPRGEKGSSAFPKSDNHLLLAEQLGAGVADLSKVDVRGLSIKEARYPYGPASV